MKYANERISSDAADTQQQLKRDVPFAKRLYKARLKPQHMTKSK